MKVVFVHPAHPNQFSKIAYRLAELEGWECSCLVSDVFTGQIRSEHPPIPFYGYREDKGPENNIFYIQNLEEGIRRGKAVLEALAHLKATRGVDVVVGHASFGTTFFIRQILNIPVVSYVELPGYYSLFCREEFPPEYPQLLIDVSLRALINASVLQSDLCIVPSGHSRRLFPRDLQHKIRVQMEGFSLPDLIEDRARLRRKLGINGKAPIVGFAGRTLEAVRGFDIFVRVAEALSRSNTDVQFLVIGEETTIYGNETSYINGKTFKQHVMENFKLDSNAFHFKPFMPYNQFTQYLQIMDLFLFPLFEGAANWGLFEAMAAGVPILASNSCFIPEVITHGSEGLLCDPSDIEGFAKMADAILSKPEYYRYLGINAREKISNEYSISKVANGYASIIKEAVMLFEKQRQIGVNKPLKRKKKKKSLLQFDREGVLSHR